MVVVTKELIWGLSAAQFLNWSIIASLIFFPIAHCGVRLVRKLPIQRSSVFVSMFSGANFPAFLFLVIGLVNSEVSAVVSDKPIYLALAGGAGVFISLVTIWDG